MNAPSPVVDVVRVLEAAAADNDCPCGHARCSKQAERARIIEARDAVRELIEVVDRATVDRVRVEYDEGPAVYEITEDDWKAIRAILSRCGGGK